MKDPQNQFNLDSAIFHFGIQNEKEQIKETERRAAQKARGNAK